MPNIPLDIYDADHKLAVEELGKHLREGSLALILGAGVSKSVGFSNWWELVLDVRKLCGLSTDGIDSNTPTEKLLVLAGEAERKFGSQKEYLDAVAKTLYGGRLMYDSEFLRGKLLIALGALMMGSQRGSVKNVVTYNYDDLLEWYLRMHGFTVNSVPELPYLRDGSDVTIFHQHGFIPLQSDLLSRRTKIIFSKHSYDAYVGANWNPQKELLKSILAERIFIAVGFSTSDPTIGPLLYGIHELIKESRPSGFWLFGSEKNSTEFDELTRHNVAPIYLGNHDRVPEFLLEVCQAAATGF